jgi:2,4-didehydro-3-deoxy-L-rhamnonate hydrolase
MKICRFNNDRIGLVSGEEIIDITALAWDAGVRPPQKPIGDPLIMALPALAALLPKSNLDHCIRLAPSAVQLMNPVWFPTKVMAAGSNYARHKTEMSETRAPGVKGYDFFADGVFLKANSSLCGAADGVTPLFPERTTQHEIELVAVIGKPGRNLTRESALDHVAAYCIGLDITMRGKEERSLRKSFDSYSVLGPWLVTSDEIPDPSDVDLALHVNDVLKQDASTSDMIVDLQDIIVFASKFYTLNPGDIIFTGTPSGTGQIRPGDRIRAHSSKIGSMELSVRNYTGAELAPAV